MRSFDRQIIEPCRLCVLVFLIVPFIGACSSTGQKQKEAVAFATEQPSLKSNFISDKNRFPSISFGIPVITKFQHEDRKIRNVWKWSNKPLSLLEGDGGIVNGIGTSDNGLFIGSVGSKVNIWSLDSLSLVQSWKLKSLGTEIEFSPDGSLVVTAHEDNKISIWQQGTGVKLAEIKHDNSISAIAISPDGSVLASSDAEGHLRISDLRSGRLIYSVEDIVDVRTLSFSKDGLYLASSGVSVDGKGSKVQIWETNYYTIVLSLPGHEEPINKVTFSPDGRYVMTGSSDNSIKVWDVQSGVLYRTLKGHNDDVVSLVFSDKGSWLASASLDDEISIWSFPKGNPVKVLNIPFLKGKTLEYIGNQDRIAFVSGNRQDIQIWTSMFSYNPWEDVREQVIKEYVRRRQDVSNSFIRKPILPAVDKLKKDDFESQRSFIKRIFQAYGKEVNKVIFDYRSKVDNRNRKVIELIQAQNKTEVRSYSKGMQNIAIRATQRVLGEALLLPLQTDGRPAYDPNRQLMFMRISFTQARLEQKLLVRIPEGALARVFHEDLARGEITGQAIFSFVNRSKIRLSRVDAVWRGKKLRLDPIQRKDVHRIIPSGIDRLVAKSNQLKLQPYGIPYTNFNDFVREVIKNRINSERQTTKEIGSSEITQEASASDE